MSTTPATHHPGRCYCPSFAPGHTPGLTGTWITCRGDAHRPHLPGVCPACRAGATDGPSVAPGRCPKHPAFEADNCPGCGTARVI